MVMTALSEWNGRDNDFNKTAHLLHLQYDSESCQQAGQLDAILKMASQVARRCVFAHASLFIQMCMHVCLSTAGCSGHVDRHVTIFGNRDRCLFTQINMTRKEEGLELYIAIKTH